MDKGVVAEPATERHEPEVRRSSRQREKLKILTYPELGNHLVTIIQSLLQGGIYNIIYNMAFQDVTHVENLRALNPGINDSVQRDLHMFKGGGCSPGSN